MDFWKAFPPDIVFKQIMVSGGAFREKHEFAAEGTKFRYFFIINAYPNDDADLVLVTATTQIRKRQRQRARTPRVLVYVDPTLYSPLEKPSVIDCASADVRPVENVRAAIEKHQVQPLLPLPPEILERVRAAVRAARTLEPRVKRLVLPQN